MTGVAELLDQSRLLAFLEALRQSRFAPAGLLLLYLVLCPMGVPVTPLVLAGGAIFGTWLGGLLNVVGLLLGGTVTFLLGRGLGRDFVLQILGSRAKTLGRLVRRYGFWSLIRIRFLPIPFVAANLGAALAGVRLPTFLVTTAVAFTPSMLVYSYFASSLVDAAEGRQAEVLRNVAVAMVLFLMLTFLPTTWLRLQRRKRYRTLIEQRRRRSASRSGGTKCPG